MRAQLDFITNHGATDPNLGDVEAPAQVPGFRVRDARVDAQARRLAVRHGAREDKERGEPLPVDVELLAVHVGQVRVTLGVRVIRGVGVRVGIRVGVRVDVWVLRLLRVLRGRVDHILAGAEPAPGALVVDAAARGRPPGVCVGALPGGRHRGVVEREEERVLVARRAQEIGNVRDARLRADGCQRGWVACAAQTAAQGIARLAQGRQQPLLTAVSSELAVAHAEARRVGAITDVDGGGGRPQVSTPALLVVDDGVLSVPLRERGIAGVAG
mmetsp:Transcript_45133/g.127665  ORF Transcript_45133/g.127665 Transcript_45133/m.127665 type:complete len:271 (-) Transcript_45133:385-1197(-)